MPCTTMSRLRVSVPAFRPATGLCAALALSVLPFAAAQEPAGDSSTLAVSAPAPCDADFYAVYFPHGQSQPQEIAARMVEQVAAAAGACKAGEIRLYAQADPGEGDAALPLALARLSEVSRIMIAGGVDSGRLAALAHPARPAGIGLESVAMRQVTIRFVPASEVRQGAQVRETEAEPGQRAL